MLISLFAIRLRRLSSQFASASAASLRNLPPPPPPPPQSPSIALSLPHLSDTSSGAVCDHSEYLGTSAENS
ncbi:hypothetical protein AAHA92_24626 [Salvia divinorum]|uniref:Uncharacterized protein n=1 Tax=Salvia divinorum TaxID=28513 RepID=A0ABD1G930_SALDI